VKKDVGELIRELKEKYKDLVRVVEFYDEYYKIRPVKFLGDRWKEINELIKSYGGTWHTFYKEWWIAKETAPDVKWYRTAWDEYGVMVKKELPEEFWKERPIYLKYEGYLGGYRYFYLSRSWLTSGEWKTDDIIAFLRKWFGEPHAEVMAWLRERDVVVFKTEDSEIVLEPERYLGKIYEQMKERGWVKYKEGRIIVAPEHVDNVKEFLASQGFIIKRAEEVEKRKKEPKREEEAGKPRVIWLPQR